MLDRGSQLDYVVGMNNTTTYPSVPTRSFGTVSLLPPTFKGDSWAVTFADEVDAREVLREGGYPGVVIGKTAEIACARASLVFAGDQQGVAALRYLEATVAA